MRPLRALVYTRRISYKVKNSIIPVTLYTVGIQHHQFSLNEISQNVVDSVVIECITLGLQSNLRHFDIHKVPLQKLLNLEKCFANQIR